MQINNNFIFTGSKYEYVAVYFKAKEWRLYGTYRLKNEKDKKDLLEEIHDEKRVSYNNIHLLKQENISIEFDLWATNEK